LDQDLRLMLAVVFESLQPQTQSALDQASHCVTQKLTEVIPKSPATKALNHLLNNHTAPNRYLKKADLFMANNSTERTCEYGRSGARTDYSPAVREGRYAISMRMLRSARVDLKSPQT